MEFTILPGLQKTDYNLVPYPSREWEALPKLPLPTLDNTITKYISVLEAFYGKDEVEIKRVRDLCYNFMQGLGPKAQDYLLKRKDSNENWALEYYLNDYYLNLRIPLPGFVNGAVVLPRKEFGDLWDIARHAAAMIDACITLKETVDKKNLSVGSETKHERRRSSNSSQNHLRTSISKLIENMKGKNRPPLCMAQWYHLFSTCRVPAKEKDIQLSTIDQPGGGDHIIIMCGGSIHSLVVRSTRPDGKMTRLSIAQLTHVMAEILRRPAEDNFLVGVLTSMTRDEWADAYESMIKDPINKRNMTIMQSSMVVLCLDEPVTSQVEETPELAMFKRVLHGSGTENNSGNRWYDKLQLIVSKDGVNGVVFDPSVCDVSCLTDLIDRMLLSTTKVTVDRSKERTVDVSQSRFTTLEWNLTEDQQAFIQDGCAAIDRLIGEVDVAIGSFNTYGRDKIKSTKCNEDVFVQLAIQFAYFKLFKELDSAMHNIPMRKYRYGRIEAGRPTSADVLKWLKAMPKSQTDEMQILLPEFINVIDQLTAQQELSANGQGIDMHLLGLREASRALTGKLPEIFCDESYKKAIKFCITSSQNSSGMDIISGQGNPYGAECHGYGIHYDIRAENIKYTIICSKKSNKGAQSFAEALHEALSDMGHLHLFVMTKMKQSA